MILVHLTDLHVRPIGMASSRVAETNMLTERALRAVRNLNTQPDAIVISGDLTENGLATEYAVLSEMLGRLIRVPVYVIPGNHDRREVLKQELAHLPGVTDDPIYVRYAVNAHDIRLVMLDTVIPGSGAGQQSAEQLAWLDETLGAEPEKPTIVVMHHPPFLCGIVHMDTIALRDPSGFIGVIAKHPQVRRILCGHHHRPINASVAHTIASVGPSVAHQVEFALAGEPAFWNLEPPAFQVLLTIPGNGIIAHTVYVETFPGPYPFLSDPDYPGR